MVPTQAQKARLEGAPEILEGMELSEIEKPGGWPGFLMEWDFA